MSAVLDASALISLLGGEPGGPAVAALLQPDAAISAVNYAEALDVLLRRSVDRSRVESVFKEVLRRGLQVYPCDLALASEGADLRSVHYHHAHLRVSLADCIGIATAGRVGGTLISSDQGQLRVASLVGVAVVPIANSQGEVPSV